MQDRCEICTKRTATTGVRAVKLCPICFEAISKGADPESYAKFSALAEAKAPVAEQWAKERAQRMQEVDEKSKAMEEIQREKEAGDDPLLRASRKCPQCGSFRSEIILGSPVKGVAKEIWGGLLGSLLGPIGTMTGIAAGRHANRVYKCLSCGKTWPVRFE